MYALRSWFRLSHLPKILNSRNHIIRLCRYTFLKYSTDREKDQGDNKPIQYSTSKAAKWTSPDTFRVPMTDAPWYQPYIIMVSVGVFLIYFLVLREENDLDDELYASIYKKVPGLEKQQVQGAIYRNRSAGQSTDELEAKLDEIEQRENSS